MGRLTVEVHYGWGVIWIWKQVVLPCMLSAKCSVVLTYTPQNQMLRLVADADLEKYAATYEMAMRGS